MLCAAAVTAQFIAGKATRDALYLASLDVTSLPAMIMACAVLSIGLVAVTSKGLREVSPAAFVPIAFVVSAMMLLAEWLLLPFAPRAAAILVYLQVSGVGPLLGSGFWLIATERFDPHTAKKRFGQIAGAGTLGGLAGGFVAERVGIVFGVAAMLPVLAAASLYCAWVIRRLAVSYARATAAKAVDVARPGTGVARAAGTGVAAARAARSARCAVPAESGGARARSARCPRRCSTTSSRRRRWRPSDGAKA